MKKQNKISVDQYLAQSSDVIRRVQIMMATNPEKARQVLKDQLSNHSKLLTRITS